jgi:hypothetical protein
MTKTHLLQSLSKFTQALKRFVFVSGAIVLISCGSNQADLSDTQLSTGISASTKSAGFGKAASAEEIKAMSVKLGSYFNGQHASNPEALMGEQTKANDGATITPKLAASNVATAVYRFFNTNTGAHFFTMSIAERDYVKATYPFFSYEGTAFFAYPSADPTLSPVYRFFNKVTGTHFFTISSAEKDHVIATWPAIYAYEGIAWHANTTQSAGWVPVYRFFNTRTGTHFYTNSAAERDNVIATLSWYSFEGIGYYVLDAVPVIPNTGITYTSQSYTPGVTDVLAMYNQQGANGYAYVGPFAFINGTAQAPIYSYIEIFVKAQTNTTYQYKTVAEPVAAADWLTMLNTQGATGYLYKASSIFSPATFNLMNPSSNTFSSLFVKSSAMNTTYSYRQGSGRLPTSGVTLSAELSELNTNGADGFAWRLGHASNGKIYNLYVKDNSSSATYSYTSMPQLPTTSAAAFAAELNTMGTQLYTAQGGVVLDSSNINSIVTIYEKKSTNNVPPQYTFDPTPVVTSLLTPNLSLTNQQMLDKFNSYAATGYYAAGTISGNNLPYWFFYKGTSLALNPLLGVVLP